MADVQIRLVNEDIRDVQGDVVCLKYTRDNYGLCKELLANEPEIEHTLFESAPFEPGMFKMTGLKSPRTLFIHLPLNSELDYQDVSNFFIQSFKFLKLANEPIATYVTTIQGADFLDEEYSLQCQVSGIIEAIKHNDVPSTLKQILIVEYDFDRFNRLMAYCKNIFKVCGAFATQRSYTAFELKKIPYDFRFPGRKEKHIFVAMPFSDDFEDTFYYGIEQAIKSNGYLSLRIDKTKFIGDIVKEMIEKIETAEAVIADLTNSNPNVYLELGYAWGKGIRTFLITKNIDELKFDVRNQRCLQYRSIRELENKLTEEINETLKNDRKNHL